MQSWADASGGSRSARRSRLSMATEERTEPTSWRARRGSSDGDDTSSSACNRDEMWPSRRSRNC
eukprot:6190667-Pleurochrysis_carterae.AAC.1